MSSLCTSFIKQELCLVNYPESIDTKLFSEIKAIEEAKAKEAKAKEGKDEDEDEDEDI